MWPPTPIYERVPVVWVLLGLLFNATGLYLGFEYPLSFAYMMVGWFCAAYGVAIFALRLRERPKTSAATRLSPQFVSGGPLNAAPAVSNSDKATVTERSGEQ